MGLIREAAMTVLNYYFGVSSGQQQAASAQAESDRDRTKKTDAPTTFVDHPPHYGGANNPFEVIKVLEAWLTRDEFIGFCKGNSLKYQARHRQKGGDQDLAKALWYDNYLNDYLKRNPKP